MIKLSKEQIQALVEVISEIAKAEALDVTTESSYDNIGYAWRAKEQAEKDLTQIFG